MNKFFTTLLLLIVTCVSVWAQAPQKMTYQSVVRNADNTLVTNANGLMTLALGEGTAVSGSLSAINWAKCSRRSMS